MQPLVKQMTSGRGLALVDDHARSGRHLHAERQRYAQQFLRITFRLDHDRGDDRQAGFKTAVLAGETNLLGIRLLPLQAELRPRRIDQRGLLGGGSRPERAQRVRVPARPAWPREPPASWRRPCRRGLRLLCHDRGRQQDRESCSGQRCERPVHRPCSQSSDSCDLVPLSNAARRRLGPPRGGRRGVS